MKLDCLLAMINTATLEIPQSSNPLRAPFHGSFGTCTRTTRQLGTKEILILFRSLVFLVIVVLLLFNEKNSQAIYETRVDIFLSLFAFSIVGIFFVGTKWFENKSLLSTLFVADTLFITAGLYLSGIRDTDLFLIFFTTVFISALSQDVKSVFSVAIVACALYLFLQYKTTGEFVVSDTVSLVRFPFLFLAAAMSGFLAMETKKHEDERKRLTGMNVILAGQADASILKMTEMNRKLKSLLEYHHCVLSSITTGLVVVQSDGKIRTFNSGARQITGCIEAEMAEKKLEEFPENLRPVGEALQRTLSEGKTYVQDHLDLKTTRGETVPVILETSVLRAGNGVVVGAIATLKDMTLLRQMETQLIRSERFSALGEMAAGVAHEIKNPLNAIMGFSQRLSDKLQEASLKKYADIISEEVRRMDTIVNDVLEYSRPDRVHKTPVDVHQVLEETLSFLNEKLEKGGVSVERFYSEELPLISMDVPKIRQVVLNLILNALQAMPQGGKLTLKTQVIEGLLPDFAGGQAPDGLFERLFLQQKVLSIHIGDTGCGIPKENLGKLFHPFFTTKTTGTGLGLSICHKIVHSHGGSLDVDSELGKGSAFIIHLPLEIN